MGEIEVFATGRTVLVEPDAWAGPPDGVTGGPGRGVLGRAHDRAHDLAHDLANELVREHHARPGRRPGQQPVVDTTSRRRGGGCDVVRPVLLAPSRAAAIAASGALLVDPVPNLEIEPHPDPAPVRELSWLTRIVGPGTKPIAAMLHLLGTTSGVVTVIELVPVRRVHWARDRVVEHGVRAIDALAVRLVRLDGSMARSPLD